MAEAHYHVGVDFGTSQTKVCVQHTSVRPPVHEFVRFPGPAGSESFFIPSVVWAGRDGRLRYGHRPAHFEGWDFAYFKIVAAEDEVFRTEAALAGDQPYYDPAGYEPFTPEVLSVWYLAFVLRTVRDSYGAARAPKRSLRGLLRRKAPAESPGVRFTVQLGFPTEYLSRANALRKRKFETILVLADRLAGRYRDVDHYLEARTEELVRSVADDVAALAAGTSGSALRDDLAARGLSVFPESAAGLASMVRTGRLDPGYYASLDIGGGSSDLSFFRVNEDRTTSYLASESVLLAANNVYRAYAEQSGCAPELSDVERAVRSIAGGEDPLDDADYWSAVTGTTRAVHRAMYRVFNQRVYRLFDRGRALANKACGTYKGATCFVYGGGSALPIPSRMQKITVHDNGNPDSTHDANFTWVFREPLDRHALANVADIRPAGEELREQMALLAVAFGLSHPRATTEAMWDEEDYTTHYDLEATPHPANEGMYVYDVVERAWR